MSTSNVDKTNTTTIQTSSPRNNNSTASVKPVEGVWIKNTDTRNKLILMNEKYSQYKEDMMPQIGEYYQLRTKDVNSLTDNKSLADFTHDNESEYSHTLRGLYFRHISIDETPAPMSVTPVTYGDMLRWKGNYNNYLSYVENIFSKGTTAFSFVNGIMANVSMEYALRENESGVIDDLQVAAGMAGAITTNPNGYKRPISNLKSAILSLKNEVTGKDANSFLAEAADTRLGIITSQLYPQALYNGATFNSVRKRGDESYKYPYITPSLFNEYGNNLSNVFRLSDLMFIDQDEGRIRADLGADIRIADDSTMGTGYLDSITDNGSLKFGLDQLDFNFQREVLGISDPLNGGSDRSLYNPREYYRYYVNIQGENSDGIEGVGFYDTKVVNKRENDKVNAKMHHLVYEDSDLQVKGVVTDENGDYDYDANDIPELKYETDFDSYENLPIYETNNSLLNKTTKLFSQRKMATMVGRFHTDVNDRIPDNITIDTAHHSIFGNSHGRNLLKLNAVKNRYKPENNPNGYENPYCRVWTYHHQYNQRKDAIRPFTSTSSNGELLSYDIRKDNTVKNFRAKFLGDDSLNGSDYLINNSVLSEDGVVNIVRRYVSDNTNNESIKEAMFSIENLAWKDYSFGSGISKDQLGPNNGRIMWFPPYDLDFQESVSVDWASNNFIGRGEKVYTYTNTDRTAQLSFTLLIDHPTAIDAIKNVKDGLGEEQYKDIDADILRFFAGCQPLEVKENKITPDEEVTVVTPVLVPIEPPEPVEDIKFAVFFPNDYSGNMNMNDGDTSGNKSNWEQKGYLDEDWWEYLLTGANTGFDSAYICGYEICNQGLTDSGATNYDEDCIWARKYGKTGKEYAKFDTGTDYTDNEKVSKDHKFKKFHYRVDGDLRQNGLSPKNYSDTSSSSLNADLSVVQKYYSGMNYSFAEVFSALINLGKITLTRDTVENVTGFLKGCGADAERIEKLEKIFSESEISKITAQGAATNQDKSNTATLAKRRGRCVGYTIADVLNHSTDNDDFGGSLEPSRFNVTNKFNDVNVEVAKQQRCTVITISFNNPETENAGNDEIIESGDTKYEVVNVAHTVIKSNYDESERRYANEYEYFDTLNLTNPFVFKSIKEKYKYFDPAFHSMSPEGFNERLNFLHQCTRQGHTVSASEQSANPLVAPTANNLAFGRMPVCVLRIGDFINTRMIIQSLNINYSSDGMQWDLNPEGVGVQPMYAKVSMGVVLLGGQTLNGPVSRLQNAQTFNYYANSGVYDDRADRITIGSDGKITYQKMFLPNSEID